VTPVVRRFAAAIFCCAFVFCAWLSSPLFAQTPDGPRPLPPPSDPTAIQSEPLPPPAEAAPPDTPALGGAAATPAPEAAPPATTMTPPAAPPSAAPQTVLLSPDWQPRGIATLQALDKHDVRVARIEVPVGQSGHFGALTIAVRACLARPPDQALDAAAFLEVSDARPGAPGFSGWMFAAEPALAILENPIYDLRVLACH
jgi:hypothetical protein